MTEEQERIDIIKACFEFETKLKCRFLDDEGQSYSDGYYCTLKREEGKNGKKWPKYIAPGEFYKIPEWCPLERAPPKVVILDNNPLSIISYLEDHPDLKIVECHKCGMTEIVSIDIQQVCQNCGTILVKGRTNEELEQEYTLEYEEDRNAWEVK
jgi:hypothetical protein